MAKPRAKPMLSFELGGPASPDRVARAARAMSDTLRAINPDLVDGDITMVVTNLNMRGEIRAWTKPGEQAVATAIRFVDKPEKAIPKTERGMEIARRLDKPLRALAEERTVLTKAHAKKPLKRLTLEFVDRLATLAELPPASLIDRLRGGDVIVTPILRVGRTRENAATMARINIEADRQVEVNVPPSLVTAFFDAAKDGGTYAVTVDITWCRNHVGRLHRDFEEAVAKGITKTQFAELPDLIKQFQADAPDAFADLDETLDSIRDL